MIESQNLSLHLFLSSLLFFFVVSLVTILTFKVRAAVRVFKDVHDVLLIQHKDFLDVANQSTRKEKEHLYEILERIASFDERQDQYEKYMDEELQIIRDDMDYFSSKEEMSSAPLEEKRHKRAYNRKPKMINVKSE